MSGLSSHVSLFENGAETWKRIEKQQSEPLPGAGHFRDHQIPFCSKYWAAKLHDLGSKLEQASQADTRLLDGSYNPESRRLHGKSARHHVSSTLRQLHAVQELWADLGSGTADHLVLVIHWSFKQAPEASCGRTYWRKVHTPPSMSETAEDKYAFDMQQFDDHAPSAEMLAETRREHLKHIFGLRSPIVLAGEEFTAMSAVDAMFVDGLPGDYANQPYSHSYYNDHIESPADDFDLTAPPEGYPGYDDINLDLSRVPTDAALQHYDQQWHFCDSQLDPQLPNYVTDAEGVYQTPSTATDSEHLSTFSHVPAHDYHSQAAAEAGAEVKLEEGSQEAVIFEHGCEHCDGLPYCACHAEQSGHLHDFEQSQHGAP